MDGVGWEGRVVWITERASSMGVVGSCIGWLRVSITVGGVSMVNVSIWSWVGADDMGGRSVGITYGFAIQLNGTNEGGNGD